MVYMDTVGILTDRLEFLESIKELSTLCNWSKKDVEELHSYVLEEIIKIDNLLLNCFETKESARQALLVWETNMEELRHWLSLILGVKIKYI